MIDLSAGKIICYSKNIEKEFLLGYIEENFFTIRTANKGTLVEPIGYTLNLCVLEDDYDFISHIQGDKRDFVCELYNGEKYSIEGCLFENMSNGFITFECDKCTKEQ